MPTFKDLCLLFRPGLDDSKIVKYFGYNSYEFKWLSCSSHSLSFIVWLKSNSLKDKVVYVYVPAYYCNSTLEVIKKVNRNVEFVYYPILESLEPDYLWISNNSSFKPIDILICTYYFGQFIDFSNARKLCNEFSGWLVEDGAHIFSGSSHVGLFGDFVVYSPHKHLPIQDGGLLCLTHRAQNNGISLDAFEEFLELNYFKKKASIHTNIFWIIKRVFQKLGIFKKSRSILFWPDSKIYGPSFNYLLMSKLSKRLLILQLVKFDSIAEIKINNFNYLRSRYSIQFNNKNNTVPYFMGYSFSDLITANRYFNFLQKSGIPVLSWPDLSSEIDKLNDEIKYVAIQKRTCSIFVPIHQDVKIDYIIKTLKIINKNFFDEN